MLSRKIVLFFTLIFLTFSHAQTSDTTLLKSQFLEYFLENSTTNDIQVQEDLDALTVDGKFPDIDYTSTRRASWPLGGHVARLEKIAFAYVNHNSVHYQKADVKSKIFLAIDHWLEEDYISSNWFNNRIRVPRHMFCTFLYLGNELPSSYLSNSVVKNMAKRAIFPTETGVNKVNLSINRVIWGILTNDASVLTEHSSSIWEEIKVSTEEGVQPDWSYHQHGAQMQFANYGNSFAGGTIPWAVIMRGTPYSLAGDKLFVFRNFVLEGLAKVLWKDKIDFATLGRQVHKDQDVKKGSSVRASIKSMKLIDPDNLTKYDDALSLTNKKEELNNFWRSNFMACRRTNWYTSVRMSSTRVVIGENINSENMLGKHLGDGMLLTYIDGDEYHNIQPNWDWHRLPGVTSDQGLPSLAHKINIPYGRNKFAGTLSTGTKGIASMHLSRRETVAGNRADFTGKKAWFFDEEAIVCLGADIKGTTHGDVYTSIQQSLLNTTVTTSNGVLGMGTHTLPKNSWIHQDGIGYELLDDVTLKMENVAGDWSSIFPTFDFTSVPKDIFSIWKNHGQSPSSGAYAYVVYPNVSSGEMNAKIANRPTILSNTPEIQAIEKDNRAYIVFHSAGSITLGNGKKVTVNVPCLVAIEGDKVTVSDPNLQKLIVEVDIDGDSTLVYLKSGDNAGDQISYTIGDATIGQLADYHQGNVALLKSIITSSSKQGGLMVSRVNDGALGNYWGGPQTKLPYWVEIDLEDVYDLEGISVFPNNNEAVKYRFMTKEKSTDDYSLVVDRQGNTDKGSQLENSFSKEKTQFVRFEIIGCENCKNWMGIKELAVYGKASNDLSVSKITLEDREKYFSIRNGQIIPASGMNIKAFKINGQEVNLLNLQSNTIYFVVVLDADGGRHFAKIIF